MNTDKIYSRLSHNPITKKKFEDVYAADEVLIRRSNDKTKFLVTNLDPSWKEGSHWVAMMISNERPCEYFDSYGKPPPYSAFETALKDDYIYNKIQLQNEFTTCCGQWTMLYIWARCKEIPLERFVKKFSATDRLLNDHLVNRMVKKIFKTKSRVIDKEFLCQQICKSMKTNKCIHPPHKRKCKTRTE